MASILSGIKADNPQRLARELINATGSLPVLLAATPERLLTLTRDQEAVAAIRNFKAASLHWLRFRAAAKPVLSNWKALLDYLHADMAHYAFERVRVLHLNTRNILIRDEVISEGTIDQSAVHVREVLRRALELGSAAIILVHNHPSGDPGPSRADIDITKAIIEAGKRLNIAVHDHLIIGASGHVSLRAKGLI